MGTSIIDIYTIGHFLGGLLTRLVIFPNNKWISFIIGNIVHTFVECLEHKYNPYTNKQLETVYNNISDIFFYITGWIVADIYYDKLKVSGIYYIYCLTILLFTLLIEFLREVFPDNKFLNGAFTT